MHMGKVACSIFVDLITIERRRVNDASRSIEYRRNYMVEINPDSSDNR